MIVNLKFAEVSQDHLNTFISCGSSGKGILVKYGAYECEMMQGSKTVRVKTKDVRCWSVDINGFLISFSEECVSRMIAEKVLWGSLIQVDRDESTVVYRKKLSNDIKDVEFRWDSFYQNENALHRIENRLCLFIEDRDDVGIFKDYFTGEEISAEYSNVKSFVANIRPYGRYWISVAHISLFLSDLDALLNRKRLLVNGSLNFQEKQLVISA